MTISTGTSSPRKALAANAAGSQAETEAILARLKPAVIAGIGYGGLSLGWAWTLLGSRKNSKPEKFSKMPQNPQRPVHALLACALVLQEPNC